MSRGYRYVPQRLISLMLIMALILPLGFGIAMAAQSANNHQTSHTGHAHQPQQTEAMPDAHGSMHGHTGCPISDQGHGHSICSLGACPCGCGCEILALVNLSLHKTFFLLSAEQTPAATLVAGAPTSLLRPPRSV